MTYYSHLLSRKYLSDCRVGYSPHPPPVANLEFIATGLSTGIKGPIFLQRASAPANSDKSSPLPPSFLATLPTITVFSLSNIYGYWS